jgi:hypothetical protein
LRHVKRSKAILLVADGFILDIKPLLAPALEEVSKFQIKIAGFRSHADADTTYIVDGISRVVSAEIKYAFP